jgi:hypothetical protein
MNNTIVVNFFQNSDKFTKKFLRSQTQRIFGYLQENCMNGCLFQEIVQKADELFQEAYGRAFVWIVWALQQTGQKIAVKDAKLKEADSKIEEKHSLNVIEKLDALLSYFELNFKTKSISNQTRCFLTQIDLTSRNIL